MGTEDIQRFGRKFANERDRLEDADIDDADRDAIKTWVMDKDGSVALSTLSTYIMRLRRVATISDVPLVDLGRDDYRSLIFGLRHDDDLDLSDTTVSNYESVLCPFLREACGREWADDIDKTDPDDSGVNPDDMLTPADIDALLGACRHQRDIALIEFLADTGARLSLTLSLRVRDLNLDTDEATFTPNRNARGLKGADIVQYPLIDSRAALRNYLRGSHPRGDDPDAAFFHRMQRFDDDVTEDDGALSPEPTRQHLQRIADRAGIEKPVNPHNFRHSAITRMAREGFSRSQIEHRVAWSIDSSMWSEYEHIAAEQHNSDIFAAAGVIDDNDTPDTRRTRCGNCGETAAPHHDYCGQCGQPVTEQARSNVAVLKDALDDIALSAEDPETAQRAIRGRRAVEETPEMANTDVVQELLTSLENDS